VIYLRKFDPLIVLLLIVFSLGLTISKVTAHPTEGYKDKFSFSGDICNAKNPKIQGYRRVNGTFKNISDRAFLITCPIFTHFMVPDSSLPEDDFNPRITIAIGFINFFPGTQDFSCTFKRNGKKDLVTVSIDGLDGFNYVTKGYTDVFQGEVTSNRHIWVECSLPPKSAVHAITFSLDPLYNSKFK
jgi:hypothetical protein